MEPRHSMHLMKCPAVSIDSCSHGLRYAPASPEGPKPASDSLIGVGPPIRVISLHSPTQNNIMKISAKKDDNAKYTGKRFPTLVLRIQLTGFF